MSTLSSKVPDVLLTSPGTRAPRPAWARPFSPKTVAGDKVDALLRLPDLTVVETREPSTVLRRPAFLTRLAKKQTGTPGPAQILFVFQSKSTIDARKLSEVLGFFNRNRIAEVRFVQGAQQAVLTLLEAEAKSRVLDTPAKRPRSSHDPLAQLSSVIAAAEEIRAESGRLSASKIAALFGLSLAELAKLLGRKRQTVAKTPDAESIQEGLTPFARAARLRAVLSEADFKAWLRLPNEQLDDLTPLAVVRSGNVEAVAGLAEDMLSGNPA